MKANIKIKNQTYLVDCNVRPFVINSIDKEVDKLMMEKISTSIKKYIYKNYGQYASNFKVEYQAKIIDYINQNEMVKLIVLIKHFDVSYSRGQRNINTILKELVQKGYIKYICSGTYKLIKKIPSKI